MRYLPLLSLLLSLLITRAAAEELPVIKVGNEGQPFVLSSGEPFLPWGFNYDRDSSGRLIEDYWENDWQKVAEDFHEMRALGANVVRIHLQFGRFMKSPTEPDLAALDRLARLVQLAEETELYLDLTGLGCYHKADVPQWYDSLPESDRWHAQAEYWKAIARICSDSPAIFCYNLMNEPVLPGDGKPAKDWLGPAFAGKHYVQFLTLDTTGRSRDELFIAWSKELSAAIRQHDRQHLITVGLVPWILDRSEDGYGYINENSTRHLDFLALHLYPKTGEVKKAHETLKGFAGIGKPVVIEEIFPLHCTIEELEAFIENASSHVAGWIGFYWGEYPEEPQTVGDRLTREWLELFQKQQGVESE